MNTAGRLLSTFDNFLNHGIGHDASMLKVWAKVFELSVDDSHLEDAVVVCLQATRSEIDILHTRLLEMGAPEELMHPCIARLRNYTSTANIQISWSGFHNEAARPENRLSLQWANWALRGESEEDMASEDLLELQNELNSLEASLLDTEMTPYLRSFIQRQINAIRFSLRVYRVQGMKPIEDALQKVAGAFTLEKARIEAEKNSAKEPAKTVLARTGTFIEKTAKIADNLDKIRKAGDSAYHLATSVGPLLLTFGQNLLKG